MITNYLYFHYSFFFDQFLILDKEANSGYLLIFYLFVVSTVNSQICLFIHYNHVVLRSGLFLISFCIIPTPCSLLIYFYSSIFPYLPPQAHFQCSFKFHCVSCITLICNSNSIFSFTPSLSLFSSSNIRHHSIFKTLYNTILLFHSIFQWSRSNDHSTIHKSPDCHHI